MEEVAWTEDAGDIEVFAPVVVIVADSHAERIQSGDVQPCLMGHIRKGAVPVIMIERHRRLAVDMPAGNLRVVQQQDVLPSIAVIVYKRAPGAKGLDKVFSWRFRALLLEMEAGFGRDVGKLDGSRDGRLCSRNRRLWRLCLVGSRWEKTAGAGEK